MEKVTEEYLCPKLRRDVRIVNQDAKCTRPKIISLLDNPDPLDYYAFALRVFGETCGEAGLKPLLSGRMGRLCCDSLTS